MLPSATEAGGARSPASPLAWLSGRSLGARLVLFGTLVTLVAIAGAFALLSVEIRRQTRGHLADLLAENQKTLLALQKRSLDELLYTSRLMTQSPTLRAAMETYESESPLAGVRSDLLATVQSELDRIRELLAKDLAVVTDARGNVLALSSDPSARVALPENFGANAFVRRALEGSPFSEGSNFGVLRTGDATYQIGCVPIVLQDFTIGTLTLGSRMDGAALAAMRKTLQSDVVLVLGQQILGSTLPALDPRDTESAAAVAGLLRRLSSKQRVDFQGEEFVAASLSLGEERQGGDARLILLRPLGRDLAQASRTMLLTLCLCALLALTSAGILAWRVSRSVLDPLERFVGFVREVARSGDHSRRFQGSDESAEVGTLNQAFGLLMDSLEEHEKRVLLQAREEMQRVERLKESEKLASLGRMLSGAAHEINNPLTGVVGNLDILLRSAALPPPARERLEKVQKEAHRIIHLVKNLLKVAHRDTGRRSRMDLVQVLRETVDLRRHDFTAAGFELRLEATVPSLPLDGNELELQQVFLNLINNAYDALKESAREPRLTIRVRSDEATAVVAFEDGGPGMKDPRKVFDHFYTTKEIGKGTGLGLSITHAIVQSHGGRISAENRSEGGARFILAFPLVAGRTEAPPAPAPPPVAGKESAAQLSANILIVEDEYTILELQMAILSSVGATPFGVATGHEALQQLQRRDYQLIISDLKLPGGFSGQELYRWIEKNRPALLRRIIFVTGDSASESTRAFLEQSGRRFLMKPFSVEEYVHAVRETLDDLRHAA